MALHPATPPVAPDESPMSASVTITALSHHGAVRSNNEDCALIGGLVVSESMSAEPVTITVGLHEPVIVAVADGLGGHGGGEMAAATAIHRLAQHPADLTSAGALASRLQQASEDVSRRAAATPGAHDMGTTLVGLALTSERVFCFSVGDSPAYRLEEGYLQQIITLDSPAAMAGAHEEIQAPSDVVTQVLGPGTSRLVPHVHELSARSDDTYLLCSDGLTDMVSLTEVERLLQENCDEDVRKVKSLWAAAMNAGGRDNITVAVVRRHSSNRVNQAD